MFVKSKQCQILLNNLILNFTGPNLKEIDHNAKISMYLHVQNQSRNRKTVLI